MEHEYVIRIDLMSRLDHSPIISPMVKDFSAANVQN
jgi:hypothetical protein